MFPSTQYVAAALRQRAAERNLDLNLEFWDGHRETFGVSPSVTLRLNRPEAVWRLRKPDLGALGEAYTVGRTKRSPRR